MKQIEQKFEKQCEPIKPEGFLQRINPYRGSWEYIMNLEEKDNIFTQIKAIAEFLALGVAPRGMFYLTRKFKGKSTKKDYIIGTLGEISKIGAIVLNYKILFS